MKNKIKEKIEVKKYIVQEKLAKGANVREVASNTTTSEFVFANFFLDFANVEVNKIYEFRLNPKRKEYSETWKLFDYSYQKESFKKDQIYTGSIVRAFGQNLILKTKENKYILLGTKELEKISLEIGNEIDFVVNFNEKKERCYSSHYKANFLKFCDRLKKEKINKFDLNILNIEEREFDGNIRGYEYFVETLENKMKFKIYIPLSIKNNYIEKYILKRNYEIKMNLLKENSLGSFRIYQSKKIVLNEKEYFYKELEENSRIIVKVKKNEFEKDDMSIYLENENLGLFRLNTSNYSLAELILLDTLEDEEISIIKEENRLKIEPLNIEQEEEIKDVKVEKALKSFSGNIFYQLSSSNLSKKYLYNRFFIEEKDVDYLQDIFEKGKKFEKLKYKYSVKNLFHFYTRLPYLKNPILNLIKEKKIGDMIIGRVRKIGTNYIDVILNKEYKKTIIKEKLKKINNFSINEFYKVGKEYEFYINEIQEDDIDILGYNPNKFKEVFDTIKGGEIIACKVKENLIGLTGLYEKDGEYISCIIPKEELSYVGNRINFKNDTLFQFKVIGKREKETEKSLILSRKRLTENIKNELETLYPIGSKLDGIYFTEDENGFYFNLTDIEKNLNMGNITGYLPFNKIALYPNKENFKERILKRTFLPYKIVSYPKEIESESLNLSKKSILLDLIDRTENIETIFETIDFSNFKLDLSRKNTIKLLEVEENKIYFIKKLKGKDIVFSIDKEELLFDRVEENNYLKRIEIFYKNIKNKKELNSAYKSIFSLFGEKYSEIKVCFKNINMKNNTIEVSFKEKIKNSLFNLEFLQNKEKEYLFSDEILNICVEILETDKFDRKNLICRVNSFKNNKLILIPEIKIESILRENIKVKVVKKIEEDKYICQIFEKKIIVNSEILLKEEEYIYIKITEINEDSLIGEIVIFQDNNDFLKNPSAYIDEFLRTNIESFSLDFLKNIFFKNQNSKFIKILNENKGRIFTGKKIKEYIFDSEEFSNGAFGKIYKGKNLKTEEKVILKEYSADKSIIEYKSFYSEAKLLSDLDEKNIMKVYYYDEDRYIAEFINGKTYREFLSEEVSFEIKIKTLIRICEVIDIIHLEGIIHLDLKPENIMIDKTNEIKLIDFGCAQSKYEKYGKYGTLLYASPLQCLAYQENENIIYNEKSDIYSLGIIMYETFTGRLPYLIELGEDGIIKGHLKGRKIKENLEYKYINPSEINKNISEELENIINKCLDEKYTEIYELSEDLEKLI